MLICSILNNAVKTFGEANLISSLNNDGKSLKEEWGFPIVVSYRRNFPAKIHYKIVRLLIPYTRCFYSDRHEDVGLTEIGIFSSFWCRSFVNCSSNFWRYIIDMWRCKSIWNSNIPRKTFTFRPGADPKGGGGKGLCPPPQTVGLLCYIICLK